MEGDTDAEDGRFREMQMLKMGDLGKCRCGRLGYTDAVAGGGDGGDIQRC